MDYQLGCLRSPVDRRDYISSAIIPQDVVLPSKFEWKVPMILDQGRFGACVGFGCAGLKNAQEVAQNDFVPGGYSPLFIYTLCKSNDGYPQMEGTFIRLGMQFLQQAGITPEDKFPYSWLQSPLGFPFDKLQESLIPFASPYKIKTYASVPLKDLTALKQAMLISPVVAGVDVFENFFSPDQGYISSPVGRVCGGHCIYFSAFDDDMVHTYPDGKTKKGFVKFPNSWNESWGNKGFGFIAYEDILRDDFVYEMWSSVDIIVAPPTPTKYYRVQVGAFTVKENCQRLVDQLKTAGFATYMPPLGTDGIYRVQLGAFTTSSLAYALRDKVIAAGFTTAFVVYK